MPCLVGYVNPTDGQPHASAILRAYDPPPKPWLPGHRGVNLPATPGTPILAAEDGIVAFAGDVAGTPVVSIDHPDGIRTTYQPVHAWVAQGEHVNEGTVIGILGSPPANDPGLHWGARTDRDTYLNPLSLLDTPTIRLKPV
ncbi:M23 family metallopeptidase [Corynebacterium sp.]|uniref:M23 family metallopeptidase n=1 Tax=Corynebacterium sp. TaxID=1720 RepID=UPI0026DAD1D3|nr:M23 family metallopeptidase [Corynebacterium sp.]MDO5075814.1 M23 family metallopeptidase [Corynebacterium sp.]